VTTYNGTNLLGTASSVNFQVGINDSTDNRITVSFGGADTTSLSVAGLAVSSAANAQSAITAIDSGLARLSQVRARFGTAVNRLQGAVSTVQSMQTNMSASLSRIRDVDIASETSSLARNQVLSQAGASVLAQANSSPQLALSLLR
jgi:flagellin